MKKLNLNDVVKVKLTDLGKDIYYHQYDEIIERQKAKGVCPIIPSFPKVDKDGYTEFQLWYFIQLYGSHIGMGMPNILQDVNIYIEDNILEEVTEEATQ